MTVILGTTISENASLSFNLLLGCYSPVMLENCRIELESKQIYITLWVYYVRSSVEILYIYTIIFNFLQKALMKRKLRFRVVK